MQAAMRRVARGRLLLIPASEETLGHGTTGNARFWREELRAFLREIE
jgi:homoserine O-acetyltransferase